MTRSIGFTAINAESGALLRPDINVAWSDRYLGAPTIRLATNADDGLPTDRSAVVYRGSELLQLKSNGTQVQFQARDGFTLAVTLAWATIATSGVAAAPVALLQSGTDTVAIWLNSTTTVTYRRSTDGGRTWGAVATLRTAAAGNTLSSLLAAPGNGLVAVEERFASSTARLFTYSFGAGSFTLADTHDTGGTQVLGGGINGDNGLLLAYAVDVPQATAVGAVTVRVARLYDLGAGAIRGTLHQGVAGGVRWRDVGLLVLPGNGLCVAVAVQLPRGTGDLSDRVSLFRVNPTAIDGWQPLGPPRALFAVEDLEGPAVCFGNGAAYLMAGSYVARLVEGSASGTLAIETLELAQEPDDERLSINARGALSTNATQFRVRLGYSGDYTEWGLYWASARVPSGREGAAVVGYGLWGALERELQQQSCELNTATGDPLTPGNILKLIFTGLGFSYGEDPTLAADLQPPVVERLRWTLRYGEPYSDLVRAILRWCGCEARAGVAANGTTPTVRVFRPGSRFGPAPGIGKAIGGAGNHPILDVVSIDPERASDVTLLPGGWDHQVTLDWYADRQLVLDAGGAYGTPQSIRPATRALARALAAADAGYVRLRPALEVEVWDTISVTDGVAGLQGARRLVNDVTIAAGRGGWAMRLGLGLE
jgi:hypothetical protein